MRWVSTGGIALTVFLFNAVVFSESATAQGRSPRIVSFGPRKQYVGRQQSYTLSVDARGNALAYRWWHQEPDSPVGHEIPYGEGFPPDEPVMTVPDAQTNRDYDGWYWCVVTDLSTGRSVRSPKGKVKVLGPPEFIRHPVDRTVRRGGNAQFAVRVAAGGPVPKSYQWFLDDAPIDGATKRTLVLRRVQESDVGFYYCRVTTIGGSTISGAALLQLK
jgi:hypothetical protein